jgi:hypothetical protein
MRRLPACWCVSSAAGDGWRTETASARLLTRSDRPRGHILGNGDRGRRGSSGATVERLGRPPTRPCRRQLVGPCSTSTLKRGLGKKPSPKVRNKGEEDWLRRFLAAIRESAAISTAKIMRLGRTRSSFSFFCGLAIASLVAAATLPTSPAYARGGDGGHRGGCGWGGSVGDGRALPSATAGLSNSPTKRTPPYLRRQAIQTCQ